MYMYFGYKSFYHLDHELKLQDDSFTGNADN